MSSRARAHRVDYRPGATATGGLALQEHADSDGEREIDDDGGPAAERRPEPVLCRKGGICCGSIAAFLRQ
jgi:hypothetical protein